MLMGAVYATEFTKVMQFVMVSFAWKFLHLSRSGVKIVQIGFAQATKEVVVGK